ncbi:hypothetical protein GCM10028895_34860 [Pontibacter rugosus]
MVKKETGVVHNKNLGRYSLMQTLLNPLFILSFILAAANQVLELNQVYIWPLHTHLDDLLVLPLTLTIALAAERAYFRKPGFILPWRYTWLAVLLFSVMFEGLLPLLHTKYTADLWDIAAYAAGAVFSVGDEQATS